MYPCASTVRGEWPGKGELRPPQPHDDRNGEKFQAQVVPSSYPDVMPLGGFLRGMGEEIVRSVGDDIGVKISTDDPVTALVDPDAIRRVVLHLAANARDAMPEGGTLGLTLWEEEGFEGRHAVLVVDDTGHGMDAETRGRIFEPFFTTRPPGVGTGLGLAMVLGIVEQSRGSIEVESEPGGGTRFRIRLPVAGGDPEAEE